jgi:acetyltransferase
MSVTAAPFVAARLDDGRLVRLRPAVLADATALQAFVQSLSPTSRYQRLLVGLRELPADMLMRLVKAKRGREAAWVAEVDESAERQIVGLAQYAVAGEPSDCEVAVVVAEAWRRSGVATKLLQRVADDATRAGCRRAFADILRDNQSALKLAQRLGGEVRGSPHGPLLARATGMLPSKS